MSKIVIYTNKNIDKLNYWNGHDLRLLNLIKYSKNIKLNNDIKTLKNEHECLVIDIPGLGIREYIMICIRSGIFIKNVFLQDSQTRYSFTKLKHIINFRRFDLLKLTFFINFFRSLFRELFFYMVCKKIGFVSDVDSIYPRKTIISKNGSTECNELEESESIRLVFWGNINYEPNIESICSYVKFNPKFFSEHNLHLFGRISIESQHKLNKLNNNETLIVIHGEYSKLEDVIYKNDILFNCVEFGSGIKNKTIEAMQLSVRQLCTTHATDGIKIEKSSVIYFDKNDVLERKLEKIKMTPFDDSKDDLITNSLSWNEAVKSYLCFCEN